MMKALRKTVGIKTFHPISLICSITLVCTFMFNTTSANNPNSLFIPGEVMVKFKPETKASRLLSQAIQSDPPDLEVLAPTGHFLSEKTGIPLKLKQLLSGGWVLWVADVKKLTEQSAIRLRERDSISGIRLRTDDSEPVGPLPMPSIELTFRPESPEYKVLQAKLSGAGQNNFAALISELSDIIKVPLLAKVDLQTHLILELDLRELTQALAKRLQSLSETIESAQLNYISTMM
ncbi:MAG: hypothetical protein ACU85E_09280 [Gammaproteobacteria bacterium]